MTISDLYLICFVVGFLLTLVSFLFGGLHLHLHPQLHPHLHLPHLHLGHGHMPGAPRVLHVGGAGRGLEATDLPAINFGTITAFLAWFGGIGYLLTRHTGWLGAITLLVAIFGGMVGAAAVLFLVNRLLLKHDQPLDPADYEMTGVLGRITSSIRAGGTGEIVYSQEGTRHTSAARSETGAAIAKGAEVVVTRYEHGIAYVRPWDELAAGIGDGENGNAA